MTTLDAPRRPDPTPESTPAADTHGAVRWQRRCLAAGGALFAVGNLLHPLQHDDAAYDRPTWEAAHLAMFVSVPLMVLGLPALHRALAGRIAHRTATMAIATMIVGLIAITPGTIIEAFVAPMIGSDGMDELASGGMAITDALGGIAFLGGMLVLGWTVHRARLRPRWAGVTIVLAALAMLAMMAGTGPLAGAVVIAATAAYGLSLLLLAVC